MTSDDTLYIDDLTLKAHRDTTGDSNPDTWGTEHKDRFDIDSGYAEQDPAYDDAGNLLYDGRHAFVYDAWNRLVEVANAYSDGAGGYTEGSTIATMQYDGLGRRTVTAVANSANLDTTYHYYYDGQSVVQADNGSDQMLKQYVWGLQYIDELCQIGVNQDPNNATYALNGASYMENECEYFYYALQDANYNVLGIVAAGSWGTRLAERYEYTPYGQRTVYAHGIVPGDIDGDGFVGIADYNATQTNWNENVSGPDPSDINGDGYIGIDDLSAVLGNWNKGIAPANNNDPLVTHARLESTRFTSNGVAGYGPALCEVGHQGLFHDEEFGSQGGLIHNRARTLHPRLGRFMQRDPLRYIDGMSLYQYILSSPTINKDPSGTRYLGTPATPSKCAEAIFYMKLYAGARSLGTLDNLLLDHYLGGSGSTLTVSMEGIDNWGVDRKDLRSKIYDRHKDAHKGMAVGDIININTLLSQR